VKAPEGKSYPMSMTEVVLIHFYNLSNEIVNDGLKKEYEPALDRLMYWLGAEFKAHDKFTPRYKEVMDRQFGDPKMTDTQRAERIRDKELLLSDLLYEHRIHLGTQKGVQFEKAKEEDYSDELEVEEDGSTVPIGADHPDVTQD
jgi:hypothetical protein